MSIGGCLWNVFKTLFFTVNFILCFYGFPPSILICVFMALVWLWKNI